MGARGGYFPAIPGNPLAWTSQPLRSVEDEPLRYPEISVRTESQNPLAWVAAVREELRLARVEPEEIDRFSEEALTQRQEEAIKAVCRAWVNLGD